MQATKKYAELDHLDIAADKDAEIGFASLLPELDKATEEFTGGGGGGGEALLRGSPIFLSPASC